MIETTTCDNCGFEYEDDGDVFECRDCRHEVCIGCEDDHVRKDCLKIQESNLAS